ncbi:hypothetical protein [Martelella radicis]|nr:hypothetical protein [Martelella radicis]
MFAKIMRRDALVPVKNERLGLDVAAALQACRQDFITADTDEKLIYAILRMNNARRDVHVKVWLLRGGLELPGVRLGENDIRMDRLPTEDVPIRFSVDYGDPNRPFFFVADAGTNPADFGGRRPALGDRLIAVNGLSVSDWCACHLPYLRWSTREGMWWTLAKALSQRSREVSPELYLPEAQFTLQGGAGDTYDLALDWRAADTISWSGSFRKPGENRYPGFSHQFSRPCFELYRSDDLPIVLLDWKRFSEDHVIADTDALITWAKKAGVLDHHVIFDGTRSRGGGYGAYVLQALTSKPFKTTFGNLRLSDAVEPFIDLIRRGREEGASLKEVDAGVWMDGGSWLWDWLVTDVRDGLARGDAYSNDVPFKLTHLPKTSDGFIDPHPDHFTGRLVAMFGPYGGSHLDQFAAMVKDNGVGFTLGMPTAGYSNTWEWVEDVAFPLSGRPAVGLMYSMGHTIRPNGELLDGNPPAVDDYIPQTRDNFPHYPELLLERAIAHLASAGADPATDEGQADASS